MLVMGMRGQLADTLEEEEDYDDEEKDVSGGDISEDRNNDDGDDGDAVANEVRTDLRPKESRQSDAGPRTFLSEYCSMINDDLLRGCTLYIST